MNETNTAALPIRITPHHLTLSPALRDFVQKKLARTGLLRLFPVDEAPQDARP